MKYKKNEENITKDTSVLTEYHYIDSKQKKIFKTKEIQKKRKIILVYPYTINKEGKIAAKKINTIEFHGINKLSDIPKLFIKKNSEKIDFQNKHGKDFQKFIKSKYKTIKKIILTKNKDKSEITKSSLKLSFDELIALVKEISKETILSKNKLEARIYYSLSKKIKTIQPLKLELKENDLNNQLELYTSIKKISKEDNEQITKLLSFASNSGDTEIISNLFDSVSKVNIIRIESIISEFETLMKSKKKEEKIWQAFFEKNGWILPSLLPYEVLLDNKDSVIREAYVGGKTIRNKEGRVVDFLIQNGFKDNFCLIELKTHNTILLEKSPYRGEEIFAMSKDFSGALSQCIDQKKQFQKDFGNIYKINDPKVILIIGNKTALSSEQAQCFELIRGNQKHVDIITFDELLGKIKNLKDILKEKQKPR